MTSESQDRLRTPPRDRFEPSEDVIDLAEATRRLLSEPQSNRRGHRQIALFHRGCETLALFCFDAGGEMLRHQVDGVVVIHVLDGRLTVATPRARHELGPGQVLRLAASVPHDVTAGEPSRMLLTVFLESPAA